MVSTRGVKLKFFEGERVLCYEPDPTKAKVLYDSKVLDIVINKDQRGKKIVEYLIHFQGWNSSWDRCVGEEYVLKDTPENRQLQKDLAEKSQLHLGAYLYRRERKKHRKLSERVSASEDGSSGSPARMDTDDGHGLTSSSGEDSSMEDETIHIELTPELREILESDFYLIKEKNKLLKLPADPNVATILEGYYKQYAVGQICSIADKSPSRPRNILNPRINNHINLKPEDILKRLTVCREVMEGLRIYFDFIVNDMLLYNPEKGQVQTKIAVQWPLKFELKTEDRSDDEHVSGLSNGNYTAQNGNDSYKVNSRRRTLRSNRNEYQSQLNGNASPPQTNITNNHSVPRSNIINNNNNTISGNHIISENTSPLAKTLFWKILPDQIHSQQPPPPCLVYGATHLARLFVKLPELLAATNISEDKLKVLLRHIDLFIDYLNDNKEWFGEQYYVDVF